MANIPLKSIKFPDLPDTYIIPHTAKDVGGVSESDFDKYIRELSSAVTLTNLFSADDFTVGGYYSSGGTISTGATSAYIDRYIPVKPSTKYYWVVPTAQMQVCTYTSDKTFIARAENTSTTFGSFTTGANVYYIRLSLYQGASFISDAILSEMPVNFYSSPTKQYAIADKAVTLRTIADGVLPVKNVYGELKLDNPKVTLVGYGYLNDYGVFQENEDYVTYYVRVENDCDCYFVNNNYTYYSIISFYDLPFNNANRISSRLRYVSGGDNTAPRIGSKLSLTGGNYIGITYTTAEVGANSYLYLNDPSLYVELSDNVHLGDTQKTEVEQIASSKCYLDYYGSTNNDGVYIYTPQPNGFLRYDFKHAYVTSINADNWRIDSLYAVDDSFNSRFQCTTSGEWECAVRLSGRPDFSGGRAHGDEVYTYLLFLVDGTPYQYSDLSALGVASFETLKIIETTTLYDPNDSVTAIATHYREYTFTKENVTIRQKLVWSITDTADACYLAMFPVAKTVSDMCYLDTVYQPDDTTDFYGDNAKAKKATVYSDTLGFLGSFEITKYPTGLVGGDILNIRDNGGGDYNKMYYNVCTGGTVTTGDVWDSETIYTFNIGEELS